MDEVEQLCNRITIMAAGELKCLGTFSYLRDKYSQGFTITIKIKENKNEERYVNQLKERMAVEFQATCKELYMNTIVFMILSKLFNWSHLFRTMENVKRDLELDDFLIMSTNLEQVFLSFADQTEIS